MEFSSTLAESVCTIPTRNYLQPNPSLQRESHTGIAWTATKSMKQHQHHQFLSSLCTGSSRMKRERFVLLLRWQICFRPLLFSPTIVHNWRRTRTSSDDAETVPKEEEVNDNLLTISFHAIAKTDHPQTLRVQEALKNRDLIVLIKGGNTHNFIDQSIVN